MAVFTYKCPNCEGPLKWDGGKEKFVCEYCDSSFTRDELERLTPDSQAAKTADNTEAAESAEAAGNAEKKGTKRAAGTVKIYYCPSCGAQVAADETTAATECFYCGNPIVISDKFEGDLDPDFVIPFEIDKKKAKDIFQSWLRQHKYVPDSFYKNRIDELKGVYFPYWVYSADIRSSAVAQGAIINSYHAAGMQVTERNIYNLSQDGNVDVNDISCIALNKASRELCESVVPFRFEDKKDFDPSYLQGYMAEIRDIDKSEVKEKIDKEVEEYAKNQVISTIGSGYSEVRLQSLNLTRTGESYKYAMLPVWTLTYKGGDGKIYYFSINGQTGKPCGVLPVDNAKLCRLFAAVAVPVFAVLLLISYFVL